MFKKGIGRDKQIFLKVLINWFELEFLSIFYFVKAYVREIRS